MTKKSTTSVSVQKLATGEELFVHAYTFSGTKAGPKIYLQANIHGPEIFGTAVLMRCMEWLEQQKEIPGSVVVVPCANPVGVQETAYNSMTGRFNAQSGMNWNRIFKIPKSWSNQEEERTYYEGILENPNLSIEQKLNASLRKLSIGSNYVLDVHTTGIASAEHLFTFSWAQSAFLSLGAPFHIIIDDDGPIGAFDESHVFPVLTVPPKPETPKVATWEVYSHGTIIESLVEEKAKMLQQWVLSVWNNATSSNVVPTALKGAHLYAPKGGYYSWKKKPGESVSKGEAYAVLYEPGTGTISEVQAIFPFTLIGIYGIGACPEGEQLAYVGLPE